MPAEPGTPYSLELVLREREGRPRLFDVHLMDPEVPGTLGAGVTDLSLDRARLPASTRPAAEVVKEFLAGAALLPDEARELGRCLFDRLLADPPVAALWKEAAIRRAAQERPLRLEVILPRGEAAAVAELPFELLADEHGFLFRRRGAVLVRAIRGFARREARIERGEAAGGAWANPKTARGRLPDALFTDHETALGNLCATAGLRLGGVVARASEAELRTFIERHQPLALVSLVAHGDAAGGALILHQRDHPDYPRDPGQPVAAGDLARLLRAAGTQVALLWSCHSARRDTAWGAVSEALLDPERGDLAAVLAAHAALRADATPALMRELAIALAGAAGGDLERALADARSWALPEGDLQWAAPVYYTRAARDRAPRSLFTLPAPSPAAPARAGTAVEFAGAPALAAHFRGRDSDLDRGLSLLRTRRLVTLAGAPGIGKSELAVALATRALREDPGWQAALWVSLERVAAAADLRARIAVHAGLERCEEDAQLTRAIGGRRWLLVLDNAEDLLDGDPSGFYDLAATLLGDCPAVRLLVTSRRPMGDVAGQAEGLHEVGRLAPPADLEAFLAAAGPRLGAAERESPDLPALVALLDGHPLSLTLVASQVGGGLSLARLRRRVQEGPLEAVVAAHLAGEAAVEMAGRQRRERLAACLDLTYEPLVRRDPGAAEAFCWLAVLPAGLAAPLIPAVLGVDGEDRVAALLRHYLAERRPQDGRIRLLAPLGWYARARLAERLPERRSELLGATWAALRVWLEAAYALLATEHTPRAVARAVEEARNLDALLAASRPTAAPATRLPAAAAPDLAAAVASCARVQWFAGPAAGLEPALADALQIVGALAALGPSAGLLGTLGDLYVRTDRLREAEQAYAQALPLYRQIEARLGEANTRKALGDRATVSSRRSPPPSRARKRPSPPEGWTPSPLSQTTQRKVKPALSRRHGACAARGNQTGEVPVGLGFGVGPLEARDERWERGRETAPGGGVRLAEGRSSVGGPPLESARGGQRLGLVGTPWTPSCWERRYDPPRVVPIGRRPPAGSAGRPGGRRGSSDTEDKRRPGTGPRRPRNWHANRSPASAG